MPELPEVETMVRDLRRVLVGVRITDSWLTHPTMLRHPDPATFAERLRGRSAIGLRRRAKSVIIDLDDRQALTIAPIMTGHLDVVDAGLARERHDHLGLTTSDGRELRLRDPRRFARFGLWMLDADDNLLDEHDQHLFGHVGPEPCDPSLEAGGLAGRLRGRQSARSVKAALLDQSVLAGIGNIYADEILWAARLHPQTRVSDIGDAESEHLLELTRAILTEGIVHRGSSVRDYVPPAGAAGMQDRLNAYGRAGQPCRRCGATLAKGVVAGRGTVWCPGCQEAS